MCIRDRARGGAHELSVNSGVVLHNDSPFGRQPSVPWSDDTHPSVFWPDESHSQVYLGPITHTPKCTLVRWVTQPSVPWSDDSFTHIAFWRDSRSIKAGPKITSPSLRLQHLQQQHGGTSAYWVDVSSTFRLVVTYIRIKFSSDIENNTLIAINTFNRPDRLREIATTYKSPKTQFIRYSQPKTSVCTSTVPWQWGLTSLTYCRHATAHWDRSDQSCRLSRRYSGSHPVGLLQRCFRRTSSLRHPTTTVSAQHSRTFGGQLIAMWSCLLSAARSSLAACQQRVEYRRCMTVHRCLYSHAPSYLPDLITSSADATVRTGLRSAASSTVAVPRTMSSLGDRSFAAAGPRAWNRLPPPLRRAHSAAVFKRQLKTFLFDRAFNWHYIVRRPCCALALTSP